MYPAILCFIHTHYYPVTTSTIVLTEFLIFVTCFLTLTRSDFFKFLSIASLVFASVIFLSMFRNTIAIKPARLDMVFSLVELKSLRDLMTPIFFYWLGRSVGDIRCADKILKVVVVVVLIGSLFELFFIDVYMYLFNIQSYYAVQQENPPWSEVVGLSLNGLRPLDIGRTIFSNVFDNHRISSIFLEPVSMGNFAVVVAAWGLSKGKERFSLMLFFMLSAICLIILSDSRYGMISVAMLVLIRVFLRRGLNIFMSILPLVCVGGLIYFALVLDNQSASDIMGRLLGAGGDLLNCSQGMLLGLAPITAAFPDDGYAYIFTRFGIFLCAFLWLGFRTIRMQDKRGESFRAYIALHLTLILCVSGTSFFALKTAGILWFLMGCCSDHKTRTKLCLSK